MVGMCKGLPLKQTLEPKWLRNQSCIVALRLVVKVSCCASPTKFTQTEGKWTIALRDDHEQIAPGPPATKYRRVEVDVPMTVPDATEHLMSERRVVR